MVTTVTLRRDGLANRNHWICIFLNWQKEAASTRFIHDRSFIWLGTSIKGVNYLYGRRQPILVKRVMSCQIRLHFCFPRSVFNDIAICHTYIYVIEYAFWAEGLYLYWRLLSNNQKGVWDRVNRLMKAIHIIMPVLSLDINIQRHMSWVFCVQWSDVSGGCLSCWCWWNCNLSPCKLSFHKY
jgi:hypothetical protein